MVEMRHAFGKRCSQDCPLRETLGSGSGEVVSEDAAEITIDLLMHLLVGNLARRGGLIVGGVAERRSPAEAPDAGLAAALPHGEGHQRSGSPVVERKHGLAVLRAMSRHHYLGYLCTVAAATGFHLPEVLQIRGSFEIVK